MSSVYIVSNKLPVASEILKCILRKFPSVGTQKHKNSVKDFSEELKIMWEEIFGSDFILSTRQIERKLQQLFTLYKMKIQKSNRNSKKHKSDKKKPESVRHKLVAFYKEHDFLFDILKIEKIPALKENEKLYSFYLDQKYERMKTIDYVNDQNYLTECDDEMGLNESGIVDNDTTMEMEFELEMESDEENELSMLGSHKNSLSFNRYNKIQFQIPPLTIEFFF
jgi:hypothetical protein